MSDANELFKPNVNHKGFVVSKEQLGVRGLRNLAEAYARAARELANQTPVETVPPTYTYYPVAQLYRHALELYLKATVALTSDSSDDHKRVLASSHNLRTAFNRVCEHLSGKKCVMEDKASWVKDLRGIEWVIDEWHRVDPSGMAFRYTIHKETLGNLVDEAKSSFDLHVFASNMDAALKVLRDLSSVAYSSSDLDAYVEYELLMARELADAQQSCDSQR